MTTGILLIAAVPLLIVAGIVVGKWLRHRSSLYLPAPPEPSIFDNTIPPGSSPLTAEGVRRAAQRLREEPPEDCPLWGEVAPDEDPGRE